MDARRWLKRIPRVDPVIRIRRQHRGKDGGKRDQRYENQAKERKPVTPESPPSAQPPALPVRPRRMYF
jgi:hypothetical protein